LDPGNAIQDDDEGDHVNEEGQGGLVTSGAYTTHRQEQSPSIKSDSSDSSLALDDSVSIDANILLSNILLLTFLKKFIS
jgi:hypothetical protein